MAETLSAPSTGIGSKSCLRRGGLLTIWGLPPPTASVVAAGTVLSVFRSDLRRVLSGFALLLAAALLSNQFQVRLLQTTIMLC